MFKMNNNNNNYQLEYENSIDQLISALEYSKSFMKEVAKENGKSTTETMDDSTQANLERVLVVNRLLETKVFCLDKYFPQLFSILLSTYDQLNDTFATIIMTEIGNQNDQHFSPSVGYWVYLIKQSLVNTFHTLINIKYMNPIHYIKKEMNNKSNNHNSEEELNDIAQSLSQQILQWLEESKLENVKTAFVDAPLLADWQIEWKITDQWKKLNDDVFHGENEQLNFLTVIFETQIQEMAVESDHSWRSLIKNQSSQPTPENKTIINESTNNGTHHSFNQKEIQLASLISNIRDVFPDLGEGFIEQCLIANNYDSEVVIMQLLENNLPPSITSLDRSMERMTVKDDKVSTQGILDSRKNIFDNDEFDIFSRGTLEMNKVYLGKKDKGNTESLLDNKSYTKKEKSVLLERIYNMYEDEIDDTYDSINEVNGPIDLTSVDDDGTKALDVVRAKKEQTIDPGLLNESDLVHAYVENPSVFERSGTARKSSQRETLRKRTNMSDEQLEGWASMFNRNPRKQHILDKYMLFDGSQEEVKDDVKSKQQLKQKNPKPKPPRTEEQQRSYKDKNKAKIGNHNRKKNHDKKLKTLAPTQN
ncbi:unnamed protein product [Cunninghamella blakesleeana]